MMKCDVIIPARGGSKGIPNKNLQKMGGGTLIERAINTAKASKYTDMVYVSTNDKDIFDLAYERGADPIWRPENLSLDTSKSEEALYHTITRTSDYGAQYICFMQCTSPFTKPEDIDRGMEIMEATGADCLFTAVSFHSFIWKYDEQDHSQLRGINHHHSVRLRRQDRQKEYLETGNFYIFKKNGFLKHRHRFFGKIEILEIPKSRAMEIDTEEDLIIANASEAL